MESKIVGIDVAKGWLDVCVAGEERVERIANTVEAMAAWLDRVKPGLVAFEPTGGYERDLRNALRQRAILNVRVHPNDVIAFRRSRGIRAKTDAIDARLIAAFAAEELGRRGLRPSFEGDEELRELAARRRQLVDALQAERCRYDLARAPAVRRSLALLIDALRTQLETIETELDRSIARNARTAELARLLQTIHGIGPIAARAAIRHPSPFKSFYSRLLIENQRPGKVALTAVMRKLLVTANAVAREHQPWKFA